MTAYEKGRSGEGDIGLLTMGCMSEYSAFEAKFIEEEGTVHFKYTRNGGIAEEKIESTQQCNGLICKLMSRAVFSPEKPITDVFVVYENGDIEEMSLEASDEELLAKLEYKE